MDCLLVGTIKAVSALLSSVVEAQPERSHAVPQTLREQGGSSGGGLGHSWDTCKRVRQVPQGRGPLSQLQFAACLSYNSALRGHHVYT